MDDEPLYVYLVYVNTDTTEGKGPNELRHIFLEERHARSWVEAQPDPWGKTDREWTRSANEDSIWRFGHMYYTRVRVITEDLARLAARRRELAEAALAKLGSEEIAALREHFGAQ